MSGVEPTPQLELTWDQVLSRRVRRQLLEEPSAEPIHTGSVLGGIQTQVVSSAIQAITIRGKGRP